MLICLHAVRHSPCATKDLVTLPEVQNLSTDYVNLFTCGSALAVCHKGLSDITGSPNPTLDAESEIQKGKAIPGGP